ncbi:hypothetical protein [Mesorhizobium sp. M0130]
MRRKHYEPKGAPVSYPNLDQICAAIKANDAKYLYSLSLATEAAIRR